MRPYGLLVSDCCYFIGRTFTTPPPSLPRDLDDGGPADDVDEEGEEGAEGEEGDAGVHGHHPPALLQHQAREGHPGGGAKVDKGGGGEIPPPIPGMGGGKSGASSASV